MKRYYVYILINEAKSCNYVGVTNDLYRRIGEHKDSQDRKSFTTRYNIRKLVYYEMFTSIDEAIYREKQIKGYRREKKYALVQKVNPDFKEISNTEFLI
jgi:putative endonuclease